MKSGTMLAVGLVLAGVVGGGAAWMRRVPAIRPGEGPAATVPPRTVRWEADGSAVPEIAIFVHRSADEALLLAFDPERGEPVPEVAFALDEGPLPGRTDGDGLLRVGIPATARGPLRVLVRGAPERTQQLEPLGSAPRRGPRLLLEREIFGPGERVRVCVKVAQEKDVPEGMALRLLRASGDEDRIPFRPEVPAPPSSGGAAIPRPLPRWETWSAEVPADWYPRPTELGPLALVHGEFERSLRLVPRFGGGTEESGYGEWPVRPVEWRDGVATVRSARAFRIALVWAEENGRILAHAVIPGERTEGTVSLPLAPLHSEARIRAALFHQGTGFQAMTWKPISPDVSADADPVLAAFLADLRSAAAAAETPFPSWIRRGDRVAGDGPQPPEREEAAAPATQFLLLRRGEEVVLPALPPGTAVEWAVHPRGAAGAFRIRRGETVALETGAGPSVQGGTLSGSVLAGEPLRLEGEAGVEGIALTWAGPPSAVAYSFGSGPRGEPSTVTRSLPERGRVGDRLDMRVRVRSAVAGRAEIACPIPRGAVPAEDGWWLARNGPMGTRCPVVVEDRVVFLVSLEAGAETDVVLPIRLLRAGSFTIPGAALTGPGGAAATPPAALVIE